jgi:molybdopterin adenylyltransferase
MTVELNGVIAAVCRGDARGGPKSVCADVHLIRGAGVLGDCGAPTSHRQLAVIAEETLGARPPGTAGENLVTRALGLGGLTEGRRLRIGESAVVQVTELAARTGEGAALWFARVLRDGVVTPGDAVRTDPAFDSPRFAVVTLSDRAATGTRADESGALAAMLLASMVGSGLVSRDVLPDDADLLAARLIALADDDVCDLIVTTGGTGLSPRDVTPEATTAVIDRQVPGIAEAIRMAGLAKTPHAMLSRAVCGQRGATLIVNLSGSPKAVREQLEVLRPVLAHILTTSSGVPQDCGRLEPA